MSSDNAQLARKIAIAAALGVGAAGLIYYVNKALRAKEPTAATSEARTVDKLKQLGNKLFSAKKYKEAVEVFTQALSLSEDGTEVLKSMCYQNRAAAKEYLGGYPTEELVSDSIEALRLNPGYGKAYWRKAKLLEKIKDYHGSLVDVFCAVHLDASFDKQSAELLSKLLGELEPSQQATWAKRYIPGSLKSVRHERVYTWLHKTVSGDVLRKEVLSWKGEPSSQYEKALQLIADRKYEEVAAVAEADTSEKQLESLILAARFHNYQNNHKSSEECLSKFNSLFDELIEPEKEAKKTVIAAKHILLIEMQTTKDQILKEFYNAVAVDIRNVDVYTMAGFRLVLAGEAVEAMKILTTESVDKNDNVKLLTHTLAILTNTDGNLAAASLHNSILELESFVKSLNPPTAYSQVLLGKVYASFGQDQMARDLAENVLKMEPNESVHYFDRSCMAASAEEAIEYLEKCLSIEPYHAEANLMCCSLRLTACGTRLIGRSQFDSLAAYLDRAESTFDQSIDFPVIGGVFRMREVLEAKRDASMKLDYF